MSAKEQIKLQVRTTKEEKAFLEKAARRGGFKTLSEFIRVSAHEKAKRDLRDFPEYANPEEYHTPTQPTRLSPKDSEVFANSILHPEEPNELLKALFSKDNEQILKELLSRKQKEVGSR